MAVWETLTTAMDDVMLLPFAWVSREIVPPLDARRAADLSAGLK
jgi:hypothetical protein